MAACEAFERAQRNAESISTKTPWRRRPKVSDLSCFAKLLAIELEQRTSRRASPQSADYLMRFSRSPGRRSPRVSGVFRGRRSCENRPLSHRECARRWRFRSACIWATNDELTRPVAIKVPHAALVSRPEDTQRYLLEARTVANLDHPHIVPVHDVGSTLECPCYIVSRCIPGTDLAARIKQSRLSYAAAAELVANAGRCAALCPYARAGPSGHQARQHPGGPRGQSLSRRFLVSRWRGQDLRPAAHALAGTPHYMSSRASQRRRHRVDGRSDIYSLGRGVL